MLLGAVLVAPALGQKSIEKRGQASMTFLLINPSPRAAGMVATNALEGEAGAVFQNPAGIASIPKQTDVMLGQTQWIADITQNAVAVAYRAEGIGVFGLSWVSMDHGDIFRTTINKNPFSKGFNEVGKVETDESVIGLAYAREITNKFSIGGQVKRVAQTLQDTRADGIAFDLGLIYYTGYKNSRLTMAIRNFSKEVQYIEQSHQMPLLFKVGLTVDALAMVAPGLEESNSLLVFSEVSHPRDSPEKVDIGMEYWFQDMIAVRLGSGINYDENNLGAGLGFKLSQMEIGDLRADYAYTGYGDVLGGVHRFAVGVSF
jgi:hypothetical protein